MLHQWTYLSKARWNSRVKITCGQPKFLTRSTFIFRFQNIPIPTKGILICYRPSDFLSISLTTNNEAHKTKINTSSDYYSTLSLTETNYFQAKDNSPKTSNFIITTTTNKHNHNDGSWEFGLRDLWCKQQWSRLLTAVAIEFI